MKIVADTKMEFAREPFSLLGEVRWLPTPEITRSAITGADAIIVRSETRVNRELLDGTGVRFVGTATIGTDHVDLPYLERNGVAFAAAPGSNANSVAEYIVSGLLEHTRRRGISLAGMTIGIIGAGNVGSRVARYAGALGMHVLLNDPPRARATGDPTYLPLGKLMDADVITLHVPLTMEGSDPTLHLFDSRQLARIKPGSLLINTSRGGVVDTPALLEALHSGKCGAAILDVWEGEPAINTELLLRAELGTAHIAGFSFDGKLNAARMLFAEMDRWSNSRTSWIDPPDLPVPAEPRIALRTEGMSDEEILRRAVPAAYPITEDDALLRATLLLPAGGRSSRFRSLRAAYRARREFGAYTITLSPNRERALKILASIGFQTA